MKLGSKHNFIFTIAFLGMVIPLSVGALALKVRYDLTGEPDMQYWSQSSDADLEHPFESSLVANFPEKFAFINLNGAMRNHFGQREMNGIVKLRNGYLAELQPKLEEEPLRARADQVSRLSAELAARDIPFLYVATPVKVDRNNPQLPVGEVDYDNENIDVFLSRLSENGTPYMDLRAEMEQDGLDHYENFYRTDHHWTTEGGFYAYTKLTAWLEEQLEVPVDEKVLNLENYDIVPYDAWHLGSRGRRTGDTFGDAADDFDLITPKFETKVVREIDGVTGSFSEVILDEEPLSKRRLMMGDVYDEVFDHAMSTYTNLMSPNDATILFVEDSFGNAVNPYMAITFGRTICLNTYEPQSLAQVVEIEKPDAVVVMQCGLTNLATDSYFDFGYGAIGE